MYCSAGGENMRTVLSVSLPEDMAAELDAIARTMGRNKSDIVISSRNVGNAAYSFRGDAANH